MKLTILLLTATVLCYCGSSYAQGRLVITGNVYGVIDNSTKLVVSNPNPNAITSSASGGFITEAEFDQVVWNIGTTTGTYTMPFVAQAGLTPIPFSASITAAGTGAGIIWFSTYPGPVWDNNTYRPSDVTHMFDYNTNTINNSAHVIDRFWIIDAQGYGTKPSATFSFTYRDAEHLQVGNTIVEADLGAQRFHPGPNIWGDYLPQGVTNTVTNVTSGVPVVPADFWRSWTLSEVTNPLASDLVSFQLSCTSDQHVKVKWDLLNETMIDHFELEILNDQQVYVPVAFIPANGSGAYTYEFTTLRSATVRLVEVESNGNRIIKSEAAKNCDLTGTTIFYNADWNSLIIQSQSTKDEDRLLEIVDGAGRLVATQQLHFLGGSTSITVPMQDYSQGVYFIRLSNNSDKQQMNTTKILKTN